MRMWTALLAAALLALAPAAAGGLNSWTWAGPYGGKVLDLAVDPRHPQRIFAATGRSVYRSEDGGGTWTHAEEVAGNRVAVDSQGRVFVVGTMNLWRSTDAGRSWSANRLGAPIPPAKPFWPTTYSDLNDLAVDAGKPGVVYVASGSCVVSCNGWLLESTDGGERFGVRFPMPLALVRADPHGDAVYVSDGAKLSRFVGDGPFTELFRNGSFRSLAFDPDDRGVLYAAGDKGVLKSTDGGATFLATAISDRGARVVSGARGRVYAINSDAIFADLPDGRWARVGPDPGLPRSGIDSLAETDSSLYAGVAPWGVLRSTDGGSTFGVASHGIDALTPTSLALGEDRVYAVADGVVFRGAAGASWQGSAKSPAGVRLVAASPASPDVVYAAGETEIHRSRDGGDTWEPALRGLSSPIQAVAVDPVAPARAYVLSDALYTTADGFLNWLRWPLPRSASCLAVAPSGSTIYLGGWGVVLRSADGGASWAQTSLPGTASLVSSLRVDARSPATVYATTRTDLFRSTDAGTSWTMLPRSARTVLDIATTERGVVYGTAVDGIYKSLDGGATWRRAVSPPVLASSIVYDLRARTLHAATSRGVFSFTVQNPQPVLERLVPPADARGNGAFTMQVHGEGFVDESVVLWNGSPLPTVFVSSTELHTEVRSEETAATGTAWISVRSPAPGGGTSAALPFQVLESLPRPVLTGLEPSSAKAGGSATLHLRGSGFVFRSSVLWNGQPRLTSVVSETELGAVLLAGDLDSPGEIPVTVFTPGGGTSEPLTFRVTTHRAARLVPVVLDVAGRGGGRYSSELTLANRGTTDAWVTLTYTPAESLGASGAGTIGLSLPAGRQLLIPDTLSHLRETGLEIPAEDQQGGTLLAVFDGLSRENTGHVSVRTVRRFGDGSVGVSMPGVAPEQLFQKEARVFGLREDARDRSHLALVNAGEDAIALRVTLVSRDGKQQTPLPDVELRPRQWTQLASVLSGAGYTEGWARVERVAGSAPFYAYGVVNDNVTQDGSVLPVLPGFVGSLTGWTVPVIVETERFSSELLLVNLSPTATSVWLWSADGLSGGEGSSVQVSLGPGEQRLIPEAVRLFRDGEAPRDDYAGPLSVGWPVYAAARTTAAAGEGRVGVFTPPVTTQATSEAWIFGLRNDDGVRSNLALGNTFIAARLRVELYSGETGALLTSLGPFTLSPSRGWMQLDSVLAGHPSAHGYARIVNETPGATFFAYGVLNDRATDDGSYLPMEP